jgi:hypothetical protein
MISNMKIVTKYILSGFAASLIYWTTPIAKADSPLTSTNFSQAYQDVELVNLATNKQLTPPLMDALSDPMISNDVRAAMINALGWSTEGQNNAAVYLDYLAKRYQQNRSSLKVETLTTEEIFALGYLLAMDDYFTLKAIGGTGELEQADALTLLSIASARQPNDFTIALIEKLVQSQVSLADFSQWCDVYQTVSIVVKNFPPERNMRPTAVDIIMEYIQNYQEYCKVKK